MFADQVTLIFSAGKGGNGSVSWARRKYEPKGGPSGGNGGNGGSIILRADSQINSLEKLSDVKEFKAECGAPGGSEKSTGRTGSDLIISVPRGITVRDPQTGKFVSDLTAENEELIICSGGRGGRGNATFKSSTRRAPYLSTSGTEGESRRLHLELKSIADIGLIGMPSSGKSSLLNALTDAKAEIGAYPFTTKMPNLGTVALSGHQTRIIADIPGIGLNAHKNWGLGLLFLRHIERTSALIFVLDAAGSEGRTPLQDYQVLLNELKHYRSELLDRPRLIALNKVDLVQAGDFIAEFRKEIGTSEAIAEISTSHRVGLNSLFQFITHYFIGS